MNLRIQPRAAGDYPWYLKPFFRSQQRRYGQVLVPGQLWGRVPRLFIAVALLYGALDSRRSPAGPGPAFSRHRARVRSSTGAVFAST